MSVLISLVIAIIVIALLVWAEGFLSPPLDAGIVRLIQAATAIIGALLVLQRFWG